MNLPGKFIFRVNHFQQDEHNFSQSAVRHKFGYCALDDALFTD
jgi:hypothetical protein